MQSNLFPADEITSVRPAIAKQMLNAGAGKIRTLGFYQPFGSLMLHGKIETRWVRKGKKPPFPLGKYIFYTTQKGKSKMKRTYQPHNTPKKRTNGIVTGKQIGRAHV